MLNLDLVKLFISPFEKEILWKHMKDHLSSQPVAAATATNLARNACDPWDLEDVFNAGTWVLKGPGTVYNELFDSLLPATDSTSKAEAPSIPSNRGMVTYKKEPATAELPDEVNSFLAMMADSNRLIVKLLEMSVSSQSKRDEELHKMLAQIKTQPQVTQSAPVQSTHGQYGSNAPGNCHFCETPGHFQVDCPLQARDDYYQGTGSCTRNAEYVQVMGQESPTERTCQDEPKSKDSTLLQNTQGFWI